MPQIVSRIVEVCVFAVEKNKPRYLLLKRSQSETLYPGIWQIVTGMVEDAEHAADAALREIREETGFSTSRFWVVPHSSSFYVASEDAIHHTAFFAAEVPPHAVPKLSREHQEFRWTTYDEALSMLVWPGQKSGVAVVQEYIIGGTKAAELLQFKPHDI